MSQIYTNSENQNKDIDTQTYQFLATKIIGDIHNVGISTKILQFMQRVRNNSDERYALRWVSELLQNTRDCAYKDQGVKILIELLDDKLIYKHNSKPFRVEDILSLINQVTSKVDNNETTGKFGTGFMTTMLLSDVVNIKSILKDNNLPYKPFNVNINRSPETSQEIVEEINKSISQLYKADENDEIKNFIKDDYNTTFTYELKNDKNRKAAMIGIQNLNETIYYIFAFSNKYKSIKIKINKENKKEEKEFIKEKETKIADNTYEILIKEDNNKIQRVIIYKKAKENICLAVMVDENKNILKIGDKMPKLFISFPLIGSEKFPFPIIINSQDLQPNETRSNIALVENDDSSDSKINKEIINKAIGFYEEFLDKLIELNYQNYENFIKIAKYKENSEHSEGFIKRNIYQNLYSIIKNKKIIKCNDDKMREIDNKNLYIIYDEDEKIRKEMKQLIIKCKNIFYPIEPDNWKENLDGYDVKIKNLKSLEDIIIDINNQNKKFINIDDNELVEWLNELFKIIRKKPNLYNQFICDKYKIFPCQEEEVFSNIRFCREIFEDPGISEYIKNITIQIDENKYNNKDRINLKQKLLSKSFELEENDKKYIYIYDSKNIDDYIRNFLKNNSGNIVDIVSEKVLCTKIESREMIDLMNLIKNNDLKLIEKIELSEIEIISKETLDEAIKNCLDIIVSLIKKCSKLEDFIPFLKEEKTCFDFLNKFYSIIKEYNYSKFNSSRIIPNCEGEFKFIKDLYGNKIEEDELYSISKKLGKSFDENIIHKDIKLDDLGKSYTDKEVAKGIEDYYMKLFFEEKKDINSVDENIKAISIGLFDWMEKNEEKVQNLMGFFKDKINRARLLDLTVVNKLHEKSKFLDEFKNYLSEEVFESFFKNGFSKKGFNDFIDFIKNGKKEKNSKIINNDHVYINIDDLSKNLWNMYIDDKDLLLRRIGKEGEKAAFKYLIKEYNNKGFIQENNENNNLNNIILFKHDSKDFVEIKLCDSFNYNQSGYDIEICINENDKKVIKYVEVKTHTINSIKSGEIKLSYNQYYMSRKNKDNYSVIVMKASFFDDKIECEFNRYFDPFYFYEFNGISPEHREYFYNIDY
jgi:hypothetical protein